MVSHPTHKQRRSKIILRLSLATKQAFWPNEGFDRRLFLFFVFLYFFFPFQITESENPIAQSLLGSGI